MAICNICGGSYNRLGIARHRSACYEKDRKKKLSESLRDNIDLLVRGDKILEVHNTYIVESTVTKVPIRSTYKGGAKRVREAKTRSGEIIAYKISENAKKNPRIIYGRLT